jgi:hypothetical protein
MNAATQFPRLPRPGSAHFTGVVKLRRLIDAVRKAKFDIAAVELLPDGTIRLLDARLAPPPAAAVGGNPLDRLHDEAHD